MADVPSSRVIHVAIPAINAVHPHIMIVMPLSYMLWHTMPATSGNNNRKKGT